MHGLTPAQARGWFQIPAREQPTPGDDDKFALYVKHLDAVGAPQTLGRRSQVLALPRRWPRAARSPRPRPQFPPLAAEARTRCRGERRGGRGRAASGRRGGGPGRGGRPPGVTWRAAAAEAEVAAPALEGARRRECPEPGPAAGHGQVRGPAGRECARAPGVGGETRARSGGTAPGRSGRGQEWGAPSGAPARSAWGPAEEAGVGAWPPATSSQGTAPPRRSVPADGPGFEWEPGGSGAACGRRVALAFKAPAAAASRAGSGRVSRPRLCSELANCGRPGGPPALPRITQVVTGQWVGGGAVPRKAQPSPRRGGGGSVGGFMIPAPTLQLYA